MYPPGKHRFGVINDDAGIPLIAGLGTPVALDRMQVGDTVARLARTRALGMPVPDGFAMTAQGTALLADPADRTGIDALRRASSSTGDSVLLRLSASESARECTGIGYRTIDGNDWGAMLEGLCTLLRYDLLENPGSVRRIWTFMVMRRPFPGEPVLVMTGDLFRRGSDITILGRDGDIAASLGRRRCGWLRALAEEVKTGLGYPVDLEVIFDASGAGWIVDCLPYQSPTW